MWHGFKNSDAVAYLRAEAYYVVWLLLCWRVQAVVMISTVSRRPRFDATAREWTRLYAS